MSVTPPPRRVVAALDPQGRSCIAIDDSAPMVIWTSDSSPADNEDPADRGGGRFTFDIPVGGTQFVFHDFAPNSEGPMHATDTLDYAVIVAGEVTLVTETGEARLRPGDLVVDRGVSHRWRNDGDTPCRAVLVLVKAHPAGKGATVSGSVVPS